MKRLTLLFVFFLVIGFASAVDDVSYCDGFQGTADATFFQTLDISGKTVSIFKTNPTINICNYEDFCERQGMNWYAPTSPSEADEALTEIRALDDYHTWILSKAVTVLGPQGVATWNGQVLTTIDSPGCSEDSSSGFSAIRDWGCSMCNPEIYGTSNCWDGYTHEYDWIACEGVYDGGNQEVPEFGVIAGGLALIGALGIFAYTRRD